MKRIHVLATLLAAQLTLLIGAAAPTRPMTEVLRALDALGPKPIATLTPEQARQQPTPSDAVKRVLEKRGESTEPEAVAKIEDRSIDGPGGPIPIRTYWPRQTGAGDETLPVVQYIHGGGWVIADLDVYDASARAIANAAHAIVVSTHYRQAPEHPFPAAHDDSFAAYQWIVQHATDLGGNPAAIAVAGESAGGNMAAAITMMAKQKGVQMPVHQVLIYPVANYGFDTPSYRENANAKPLDRAGMKWFFAKYLGSQKSGAADPRLSLLDAKDVRGLPPATIVTAEIDPLRSEGQQYADKLKAAGVPVDYKNYEGVTHEFFGMGAVVPEAKQAVQQVAEGLRATFDLITPSVDDKDRVVSGN